MGHFQGRFARVAARSVTAAAVSLAVLGAATSAQASVIFDFGAIANGAGGGVEGIFINSAGYATEVPIKVQASASNTFGVTSVAYLDANFNSKPAGLGVCSTGLNTTAPVGQCSTPSDDNVTSGETLTLSFFDSATMNPLMVVLNPTFFRDSLHNPSFNPEVDMIDITDIFGLVTYSLPADGEFTPSLTGTTFDFTYNNAEFYIESITVSAVPLPAALPLFLSALAGLALLGRRQRKKAAA